MLNMSVHEEFRLGDCDEVMRKKDGVFTLIDIEVEVELDIKHDLQPEQSEGVEEPTHFLIIIVEDPTDGLNKHNLFPVRRGR